MATPGCPRPPAQCGAARPLPRVRQVAATHGGTPRAASPGPSPLCVTPRCSMAGGPGARSAEPPHPLGEHSAEGAGVTGIIRDDTIEIRGTIGATGEIEVTGETVTGASRRTRETWRAGPDKTGSAETARVSCGTRLRSRRQEDPSQRWSRRVCRQDSREAAVTRLTPGTSGTAGTGT